MKKVFFLTLCFIVLFSFFSVNSFAVNVIIKPPLGISEKADPSINVTVGSSQVVLSTMQALIQGNDGIIGTTLIAGPFSDTVHNQTLFTFKPGAFLENGNYSFFFSIQDSQGNLVNASAPFGISVDYMRIELVEPSLGMSSKPNFDVMIATQYDSLDCRMGKKLSFVDEDELGDVYRSASKQMTPVDSTKQRWAWRNLTEASDGEYIPYWFVCTYSSSDNYNLFSHRLGYDTTPPVITEITINPNPVVDPANRNTNIKLKTDDLALCKYKDLDSGEVFLSGKYTIGNISNYLAEHEIFHDYSTKIVEGFTRVLADGSTQRYPGPFTFNYQAICRNLAGNESRKNFSVTVRINTTIGMQQLTERFVKTKDVDFKVKTNIRSACIGNIQGQVLKNFSSDYSNIHTLRITNLAEGENNILVRCSAQDSEEKVFKVFVDTKPPLKPKISLQEKTCSLSSVQATIAAEDNESGIALINYSLFDGSTQAAGWRSTNDNPDTVRINADLSEGKDYTLKAFATDRAGNIGATETKTIEASTAGDDECDNDPPAVNVNIVFEQPGATMANLSCTDSGIGCRNTFNYSLHESPETSCTYGTTKNFDANFLVEQTSYLCYRASDLNNNAVSGKIRISVKTSGQQQTTNQNCSNSIKDDGEADVDCGGVCINACEEGKTCNSNFDCVSGYCNEEGICQEASCEDGVKNGLETDVDCGGECTEKCLMGSSCEYDADCYEDLICSGYACKIPPELDTDSDGLPDTWEYKYFGSRTGADPKDDFDRDGSSNLDEYNYGTDPTDKNSRPEKKSVFPLILLILGIILIAGGAAYIFLTKTKLREREKIFVQNTLEINPNASSFQSSEQPERAMPNVYKKRKTDRKKSEIKRLFSSFDDSQENEKEIKPLEEVEIDDKKKKLLEQKKQDEKMPAKAKKTSSKNVPGDEYIDIEQLKTEQEVKKQDLKKKVFEKLEGIGKAKQAKKPSQEKTKQQKPAQKKESSATQKTQQKPLQKASSKTQKQSMTKKELFDKLAELSKQPKQKVSRVMQGSPKVSTQKMLDIFANVTEKKQINQDVFKVILSELLSKQKITKNTVSDILLNFLDQELLTKKEVDKIMTELRILR